MLLLGSLVILKLISGRDVADTDHLLVRLLSLYFICASFYVVHLYHDSSLEGVFWESVRNSSVVCNFRNVTLGNDPHFKYWTLEYGCIKVQKAKLNILFQTTLFKWHILSQRGGFFVKECQLMLKNAQWYASWRC